MPPEDRRRHVSHQTIYRWLWSNPERAAEFTEEMRHGRYRRRKRFARPVIRNRVSIHQRPSVIEARHRVGDWEGDTIVGRAHSVDTWQHSWIAAVAIWWPPGCVTSDRSA